MATADSPASGEITVRGKPLAEGKVTFHRENGQFMGSKVKDGKYMIDRLPAGTLKVTFDGKGISPKYQNEDTSPLRVMVNAGPAKFDFNLM